MHCVLPAVLFVAIPGAWLPAQDVAIDGAKQPPADAAIEEKTISELKQLAPPQGWFRIEGFAIDRFDCPPCPPEAVCAPCMGNRLTISEKVERPERYRRPARQLIVNAGHLSAEETFSLGRRYSFLIHVTARSYSGDELRTVNLV